MPEQVQLVDTKTPDERRAKRLSEAKMKRMKRFQKRLDEPESPYYNVHNDKDRQNERRRKNRAIRAQFEGYSPRNR